MRVPTMSAGTRSGVNWMRVNVPPITRAIVDTVSRSEEARVLPILCELLLGRPPDASADDGCRDEIGGELDAGERAAHHAGHRRHGQCLGEPWYAFDEAVPLCEQADEGAFHNAVLADDDALYLKEGVFED